MGVGKTTACRELQKRLNKSIFLDGDWCWDMNPFCVTEETKQMVMDNICYMLNNFLHCSAYEHVLFCWVMHEQGIIDELVGRLDLQDCRVKTISLVCSEESLKKRLQGDIDAGIRTADAISRSCERLPLYQRLHTEKIDVSALSVAQTADSILKLI